MFGFRSQLSTQDILLQLKEHILDNISRTTTQAVLDLNIKGAFDNVSHTTVLQNLASTNCGQRTYEYVRDFLKDRTATIGIESIRLDVLKVPGKGTPQGSVLSPTLFNLAMCKLPPLLESIPHIKHTLYADDLTLWTTSGTDGNKQDSLQKAVDTVQRYLEAGNLQCAPEKSELLLFRSHRRKTKPPDKTPGISLVFRDGTSIPIVKRVRILGLYLEQDGRSGYTISQLTNTTTQIIRMMSRITSRTASRSQA